MKFKRAQSKKGVEGGTERRADKKTEEARKKWEKRVQEKRGWDTSGLGTLHGPTCGFVGQNVTPSTMTSSSRSIV